MVPEDQQAVMPVQWVIEDLSQTLEKMASLL